MQALDCFRKEYAWIRAVVSRFTGDTYDRFLESQSRCTGIELLIQLVDDLTRPETAEDLDAFLTVFREKVSRMCESRFPLLGRIDWDIIESKAREDRMDVKLCADFLRRTLMGLIIEHGEFVDLFASSSRRIPRDVDGNLLMNRDAGCSPPCSVLGAVPQPFCALSESDRREAVEIISKYGIVNVRNAVPLEGIEAVRNGLGIRSTFSDNGKRFQTRETDPQKIFEGDRSEDVSFTQLAPGRFAYRLRCSKLESLVKPLHAGVMPLVWDYLYSVRRDSYLHSLSGDISEIKPKIFLSEVSLLCSDPLAGQDAWHATNGAPGVVVLVPLSPFENKNGNTLVLPGSHKLWAGNTVCAGRTILETQGALELEADVGDVVVLDSRIMRKTERNELFNRSKVWLAFHYDFHDTPAPYQWLPRTMWMHFLAVLLVKMEQFYRRLPY